MNQGTTRYYGTALAWSTGKDSLLALRTLDDVRPILLTTLNDENDRVSMHGLREELLRSQIDELELELHTVRLPPNCSNDTYEQRMADAVESLRDNGVREVLFGDLFLEDVRSYREEQMKTLDVHPRFPLWQSDTEALAREFLSNGYRAVVVCVDTGPLDEFFAGREYDEDFLADLPGGVDPCGENGEFHTFVYDGPEFEFPVDFERGITKEQEGFVYQDLLPA